MSESMECKIEIEAARFDRDILDNCILHVCRELQNAELKEKDSAASHRLERPRFRYVMKHKSLRYKSIVYNIIHLRDTMS